MSYLYFIHEKNKKETKKGKKGMRKERRKEGMKEKKKWGERKKKREQGERKEEKIDRGNNNNNPFLRIHKMYFKCFVYNLL